MTESYGAICGGVNRSYQVRVRRYGQHKYELVGTPSKTFRTALKRLAEAFGNQEYKRGDVVMSADYYDPVVLCEIVR